MNISQGTTIIMFSRIYFSRSVTVLFFTVFLVTAGNLLDADQVDKPHKPSVTLPRMCYRSFWPQEKYNRQFAEAGVRLVFIYPSNTISSIGVPYSNYPMIWTGPNQYDWTALDRHIEDVLTWNPGAKLIVMIDLNTPPWWAKTHEGSDSVGQLGDVLLREDYRRDSQEYLHRFLEHTEAKYRDKIAAYHLSAGMVCEWFDWLHGKTTPRKDAAFAKAMGRPSAKVPDEVEKTTYPLFYDPVKDADKIAYWKFHNQLVADAAVDYARRAKQVTKNRVPIGLFFGYMMANGTNKLLYRGHLAYDTVYQSPAFDTVSAPAVYQQRSMGGTSGFQFCQDSILTNGKILWHEIDHRTHLLKDVKQGPTRYVTNFGKGISFHSKEETIAGLRREFAIGMIAGAHLWWFDMFGGFFDDPDVMAEIKHLNQLSQRFADTGPGKAAEVALFADADSMYYVNGRKPLTDQVLRKLQFALFRTGTPWRCHSLADLTRIDTSQFKVIILPNLFALDAEKRQLLEKMVLRDGKTVVTLFAPGIITDGKYDVANIEKFTGTRVDRLSQPGDPQKAFYQDHEDWTSVFLPSPQVSPKLLRDVFRKAKVHLYSTTGEPLYANEDLVALHTAKGGKRTIRLPRPCRVTEVFENRVISDKPVLEFTETLPAPATRMYFLEPIQEKETNCE